MSLKDYMKKEIEQKKDENVFESLSLELSENEMRILKRTIINEELSIPSLVNIILRDKAGNVIKEENKEELLIREFITENGNITEKGKAYIESEEVKERLNNSSKVKSSVATHRVVSANSRGD